LPAHKPGPIEMIATVDQNIAFWYEEWKYARVVGYDIIPLSNPFVIDLVREGTETNSLDAGKETKEVTLDVLKLPDDALGHWRMKILDDIAVTYCLPRTTKHHATLERLAEFDLLTMKNDPCHHTTEFFTWKSYVPTLVARNPTEYEITKGRIAIYGFIYYIELLPEKPEKVTYVNVTARRSKL